MIFFRERTSGDGNVHAVEIGNRAEHEEPEDQRPANAACGFAAQEPCAFRIVVILRRNHGALGFMDSLRDLFSYDCGRTVDFY